MDSSSELTLRDVIDSFEVLSSQEMQGNDSRERKMEVIQTLYKRCGSPLSLKYLVRSLNPTTGLRIGLSGRSLEKCFLKFAEEYKQASTIEEFERDIFGYRIGGESKVILNIPFKAMIGRPSKTADEVIEHFQKRDKEKKPLDLIAEIKYDGERSQIHYDGKTVNLYSRNFTSQNQKFYLLKERLEL